VGCHQLGLLRGQFFFTGKLKGQLAKEVVAPTFQGALASCCGPFAIPCEELRRPGQERETLELPPPSRVFLARGLFSSPTLPSHHSSSLSLQVWKGCVRGTCFQTSHL
jgi:hypothetical protein